MNANETMTEVDGLCIAFDSIPTGLSPAALPAHTKFLCTLESKISNGDLQEVDLIIGCPLLLPEFDCKDPSFSPFRHFALMTHDLSDLLCRFCWSVDVYIDSREEKCSWSLSFGSH